MPQISVIDVETTGFSPYGTDRIVEIAIVNLDDQLGIVSEFTTLINPQRDVGPTRVHGITASLIGAAPSFADAAGHIVAAMKNSVAVAGHNVLFDLSFIAAEFERLCIEPPDLMAICTMQLAGGGTLESACSDFEVPRPKIAHSALHDARATALLFQKLLDANPEMREELVAYQPKEWPEVPQPTKPTLTRAIAESEILAPSHYLQKLARRMSTSLGPPGGDPSPKIAYAAILTKALQDRQISEGEANSLVSLADRWKISSDEVSEIHAQFIEHLQVAALADGVVTEAERRDLRTVAGLLGVDGDEIDRSLNGALQKFRADPDDQELAPIERSNNSTPANVGEFRAKLVCFTGESMCRLNGRFITRPQALQLAAAKGIEITDSITKKVDFLVVADPCSQSGKAQKARKYGIPLMQEFVFWRKIGINVQ